MTDQSDRPPGIVKRLEQSDGNLAFCKIPHWTVPAHIEDRIVRNLPI